MARKTPRILRILDVGTEKVENAIMSFGLLGISAIVFINVIGRYFFSQSFAWSEELARYIIVWVTFFGISSCARYDTHVKVDLLYNLLRGVGKVVQQVVVTVLMIGVCAYMTYISASFTLLQFRGGNTSISVAVPIWVIYLSTLLGFLLCTYNYLRKLIDLVRGGRDGEGVDEAC